ncbi:MAG: DUF835 domain-containing protein [Candidatus Thermoplasmatota archaeon]|nr:DUF835 domain-containing protein [Candidatus Thermoplasmatota archaeon]MBS3789289.1 DUF835 domain-containing protein [Candidatus Thermoplasmatota archaeon]
MIRADGKDTRGGEGDKRTTSEIEVSSLNKSVRDVIEDLESDHEVYGDETVKRATLKCLKHLQDKKELSHKELKMSIYLDFLDNPTLDLEKGMGVDFKGPQKEDLWEMGKTGLDYLEEKTSLVESSIDEKGRRYRWKTDGAETMSLEERDLEDKPLEDLDKQILIESGKQFLNTIYGEKEKEEKPVLEKGESYLTKDKKPKKSLEFSLKKMEKEGKGYVLSSINPDKINRKYEVNEDSISFNWLTGLEGKNRFKPSNLHLIAHSMINFLEDKNGPIFIGGVEIILKHNSFDRFLGFLNHLVDVVSEENGILVLSLDPRILSDQQLAKIERKFEYL